MKHKQRICFLGLSLLLMFSAVAEAALAPMRSSKACEKIVAVVDLNWPPYAIKTPKGKITGLAVDLIEQIFSELDLPVVTIEYLNKREVDHALSLGDIDMILATYETPKSEALIDLIRPGFIDDPYMVVLRQEQAQTFERFEDLIGNRGLSTQHFAYERHFNTYRDKYLYVQPSGTLEDVLALVSERKADYVLGSRYQLEYGLDHYNDGNQLIFAPHISAGASVHMAFSKASSCHHYLAYVRKRLLALKKEGKLDQLLQQYVKRPDLYDDDLGDIYDPKLDFGI